MNKANEKATVVVTQQTAEATTQMNTLLTVPVKNVAPEENIESQENTAPEEGAYSSQVPATTHTTWMSQTDQNNLKDNGVGALISPKGPTQLRTKNFKAKEEAEGRRTVSN